MKDIKTFLIGFLSCACLLLIMGQTKSQGIPNNQAGKYQAIAGNKYESLYLLDTETGEVYTQIENPEKLTYKKRLADVWRRNPYVNAFSKP
tara:strand:- start:228 stop:500 length:273 start_codon:yes stop_codon:yes gene_type:complete